MIHDITSTDHSGYPQGVCDHYSGAFVPDVNYRCLFCVRGFNALKVDVQARMKLDQQV